MASSKDPVKVERQLEVLVPRQRQTDFCHRLVHFGRDCCIARAPRCDACVLADCCDACQKGESA
ncbi:MAG: endonuclease III domain-containing protein [Acutalibacteraceae bacterium]